MKGYIDITKAVSDYVKHKGVTVTALSKATGIPYGALLPSITGRRKLRADEFLAICDFLEIAPEKFQQKKEADNQDKAS